MVITVNLARRSQPEQQRANQSTFVHHHQKQQCPQVFTTVRILPHEFQDHQEQVRVLAFSVQTKGTVARHEDSFLKLKLATEAGRVLLSDRKGWTDHLTTPNLAKSLFRVTAIQSSNMFATYVQDQFQADFAREELVKQGKLTAKKADEQQEEWEQTEWNRRLKELPQKIMIGLAKFHSITMLMRCLEYIAEKWCDEFTLDRLTMDTFEASLRASPRSRTKTDLSREMYSTCLWANAVAYMADYSVHQIILAYTYYCYYQSRKRRKMVDRSDDLAPLLFSYLTKSTSLIMSRGLGLLASAFGGAWGSVFYPGWGTMVGSQVCDAIVASVFDELQPSVMKEQVP